MTGFCWKSAASGLAAEAVVAAFEFVLEVADGVEVFTFVDRRAALVEVLADFCWWAPETAF
jgi:hypothetical protein